VSVDDPEGRADDARPIRVVPDLRKNIRLKEFKEFAMRGSVPIPP
jgi:hypothetical protein